MKRTGWMLACAVMLWLIGVGGTAGQAFAPSPAELERFDVKKGAVSGRVPSTPEIQEEAVRLVQSLSGSPGIVRGDPKNGTVLRVPLSPPVEVRQPGFFALATEMYLFLPEGKDPYMLLFSEENEPRLFALNHPVDRLLELCGWQDARGR